MPFGGSRSRSLRCARPQFDASVGAGASRASMMRSRPAAAADAASGWRRATCCLRDRLPGRPSSERRPRARFSHAMHLCAPRDRSAIAARSLSPRATASASAFGSVEPARVWPPGATEQRSACSMRDAPARCIFSRGAIRIGARSRLDRNRPTSPLPRPYSGRIGLLRCAETSLRMARCCACSETWTLRPTVCRPCRIVRVHIMNIVHIQVIGVGPTVRYGL